MHEIFCLRFRKVRKYTFYRFPPNNEQSRMAILRAKISADFRASFANIYEFQNFDTHLLLGV